MRFAYADPPYRGGREDRGTRRARGLYGAQAAPFDELPTWAELLETLDGYDGFALSLSTPSLLEIAEQAKDLEGVRVLAWVKPWASYKPGAGLKYAWEPVLLRPLRRPDDLVRDWTAVSAATGRGLAGAKPLGFVSWIAAASGLRREDETDDLFPGTGGVGEALRSWRSQPDLSAVEVDHRRRG